MITDDLNLLAQLAESMELAVQELEKGMETREINKIKTAKREILNFQKQIGEILVRWR